MSGRSAADPRTVSIDERVGALVLRARDSVLRATHRVRPDVATAVALAALMIGAAVFLFVEVRPQWFIYDEFDYLAPPVGASLPGWIIAPHNEHTIVFTKLWFSTLYNTIGLRGYSLYALPMILCHLAGGLAVFKLLRLVIPSRIIALAAVAPLFFMAAGVGTLTWAGQFQYTGATAAGLWVLYLAVSPRTTHRLWWIVIVLLGLFGNFSGSAYIPLGVAAGLALLSLGRYVLGVVTVLIPAVWFVLVRLLWKIPSYNSAHDLGQVLRDGPDFVFGLLNKAINDSIPIDASFTTAIIVVSSLGVLAFLARRPTPGGSSRARRTYLFLLLALTLSLVITLVGRLSRDLADSTNGGYNYFILIAAIPVFVASIVRFTSGSRIAVGTIVLLLAGWTAIGAAHFDTSARDLAAWKTSNPALLDGAAYLSLNGFPVASDAAPSPAQAPTVSWSELQAMAAGGKLDPAPPATLTADELSLTMQWTSSTTPASVPTACEVVEPHSAASVSPGVTQLVATPVPGTTATAGAVLTIQYPTSAASRAVAVAEGGTEITSVVDRSATLTTGDQAVRLCQ
ncbi:hypothetical protein VD659_01330 [Herbiconiux sp. 11R-BC]|uniref:hypothetical protein n=1 Tax=Herbiconiux sp. 11R-BC TaxID=3111637 RepID=UPI003C0BBD7F